MSLLGAPRAALRAASFAVWTTTALAAYRAAVRLDPTWSDWPRRRHAVQRWTAGLLPIFGLDVTVRGAPPGESERTFLVVANHRSPLDILLSLHFVGGVVLSHDGVADMPIVGPAAKANETIFVNQEDRKSGALAVRAMRKRLQQGRNVIAFPEGNTFRGDEVRPFHPGAFLAARGLDHVEVLPLGLAYEPGAEFVDESFEEHLYRMSAHRRTRVWMCIGQPRAVPGRGDEEAVRAEVQALVDTAVGLRDASTRA